MSAGCKRRAQALGAGREMGRRGHFYKHFPNKHTHERKPEAKESRENHYATPSSIDSHRGNCREAWTSSEILIRDPTKQGERWRGEPTHRPAQGSVSWAGLPLRPRQRGWNNGKKWQLLQSEPRPVGPPVTCVRGVSLNKKGDSN